MKTSPPTKFVGLHSHTTFSTFDAIGTPKDHIDFVIRNGGDALACTEHGNMNSFSHQYVHSEKLRKAGQKFKPIFGVEAYFIPSITDWTKMHDNSLAAKAEEKRQKKAKKVLEAEPGNEMAPTEAELDEMADVKADDGGDEGGTIIENEEESKKQKFSDPIKARNHLVLLAKNDQGLKDLFRIVSDSSAEGSYNGYPRVDFESLRKHAKGNIIALTACIAGYPARIVFDHQTDPNWDNWLPTDKDFELIQGKLKESIERFQEVLGKENYYLEMQFNKLGPQHLVNMHLLEASKRTGAPLVVTADAHYSDPSHWREHQIYKLLNPKFASRSDDNAKKIPEKVEDLKCELYPKNADQMWAAYKQHSKDYSFYDDNIVREAIERTYVIAHEQIGSPQIDRKVKLPAISRIVEKPELDRLTQDLGEGVDEDSLAFKELKKLAIEGLKFRRAANQQNYIDRLKYELEIVKTLKFSKYFLTYAKIMEVVGEKLLIGNARGSAGGSLLAYVLNITQMDPIKHGLLFERFMTRKKRCLLPTTYVVTNVGACQLQYLDPSFHKVLTHTGEYKPVVSKVESEHQKLIEVEVEDGTTITCSPNHLWVVVRDGQRVEIRADELRETDELIKLHFDKRHAFEKL